MSYLSTLGVFKTRRYTNSRLPYLTETGKKRSKTTELDCNALLRGRTLDFRLTSFSYNDSGQDIHTRVLITKLLCGTGRRAAMRNHHPAYNGRMWDD